MKYTYLNHFYPMPWRTLILLFLLSARLLLGGDRFWVFLEDAPPAETLTLTDRAQSRLTTRGIHNAPGSQLVSAQILEQIRATGVQIRHASRFLRAVSIETSDLEKLQRLATQPNVIRLQPFAQPASQPISNGAPDQLLRSAQLDYGFSTAQNDLLSIPAIHDLGYSGAGVLIAIFDTGFYPVHPCFEHLDIVGQYDFVDQEPDAAGVGHEHGINVLSALGGYVEGQLIGPAYGASYLLARTEDQVSETRSEEDSWVAALEWADSLGVDIVSSSLNYREFDDPNDNYPYSAIDGQTAIITQAANIAAQRGILVVNSVGNEGSAAGSVWPPADSPLVLSVGAISASGSIMSFSSRGPTFDGRIKPDVVTLGSNVYVASGTANYRQVSGTSFATPLMAGLAALLLEAEPFLTPAEIIDLFRNRGDRSTQPDNAYGYGIPDLQTRFERAPGSLVASTFPNPYDGPLIYVRLPGTGSQTIVGAQVFDLRGRLLGSPTYTRTGASELLVNLSGLYPLTSQIYFLRLITETGYYTSKFTHLH